MDIESPDTVVPSVKPHITGHFVYLTIQTSKNPKNIKYSLSIMMKDSSGKQYVFRGVDQYQYDESGQAYSDLEVIKTMDKYYKYIHDSK